MNILIIGNGFDLAHGLPTKYWDFLMFAKCVKEASDWGSIRNVSEFSELNPKLRNIVYDMNFFWSAYSDGEEKEQSKNNLIKFKKIVNGNIWLNYFLNQLDKEDENKGWIDFEYEISQVIQSLDLLKSETEERNKKGVNVATRNNVFKNRAKGFLKKIGNEEEKDFCGTYAKEVIKQINNELNELIEALEIYLIEFVGKIDVECQLNDIIKVGDINKILSFNYTNTYEKYYENNSQEGKYDYIHGRIRTSNDSPNNMVLGIDEYLDDDRKDKEVDFIQFKKYFQRIYKKTGCEYKKWVEKIKFNYEKNKDSNITQIQKSIETNLYIFGHSLDITDKDILKELIMMPKTTTNIYYYDDKAYKQYIVNLVKLIGQDRLTDWVHGSNPRIKFVRQQ